MKAGYAQSFKDLIVYQKARVLAREVFNMMEKANSFCVAKPTVVQEDTAEYFVH